MVEEPSVGTPRRALFALCALLLAGFHAGLTEYFLPVRAVFGDQFVTGDDFDLHIGQIRRVVEGLSDYGQSWVYDVKLLAGQPEGTITDSGSKGWELWSFALHRAGLSLPAAYNSFIWFVMLACPLCVWAASRLFGLSRWASLLAAALASCLWFFDSFFHWVWWVGMVSYGGTSYFVLLPFALFYRFVQDGRIRHAILCALTTGITHLVHPYSLFALGPAMAALYFPRLRQGRRSLHVAVAGIVVFTLVLNLYWLRAAALHWHYILDSAFYGQGGLRYLLGDFFGLLQQGADTGVIGVRTGFRLLAIGLALAGLLRLRRTGDPRALSFGVALLWMLLLAYLGQGVPGAGQIQPYRLILPASMLACVIAALFVEQLADDRVLSGLPRGAVALLCVIGLVGAQKLAYDSLYFMTRALPDTEPFPDGTPSPMSKYGHLIPAPGQTHVHYGLPHESWLEPYFAEVLAWVKGHVPAGQRVLIDATVLGERIAWQTDAEVMGGFFERNTDHAYANFFRRYEKRRVSRAELERYLKTYAIRYVIAYRARAEFDAAFGLLEAVAQIGGFRIYETRVEVSPLLSGTGALRARTNRIEVRGSDPGKPLVLSYQWHEALRCTPDCTVERHENPLAPVGLIRIPAPHPRDIAVVNSYAW